MSSTSSSKPLAALTSYVVDCIDLGSDLTRLVATREVGAVEGAIFYATRITEALAHHTLNQMGLAPSFNLYSNLLLLESYGLMTTHQLYWGHAMRWLGNDVRHLRRRVNERDMLMSLALLERILHWFFTEDRIVLSSPAADSPQSVMYGLCPDRHLCDVMETLDRPLDAAGLKSLDRSLLMDESSLAAVYSEHLIAADRLRDALEILEQALTLFPENLRLRQLRALGWSREGRLDAAREELEALYRLDRDPETAGILGGVCKRSWLADPEDRRALERSHRVYGEGWKASKCQNAYLGINAAAIALYADQRAESRRLASEVRDLLRHRRDQLARHAGGKVSLKLNLWDRLTLAEALLLMGESSAAASEYSAAMQGRNPGHERTALNQLKTNLAWLGLDPDVERFLSRGSSKPARLPPFIIGITGHRRVPDARAVGECLDYLMDELAKRGLTAPLRELVLLSAFADGADRLLARGLLDRWHGAVKVEALLPLEIDDYRQDFASEVSREEFQEWLNRADRIEIIERIYDRNAFQGDASQREQHYWAAGRAVVERCNLLLAYWNGAPARGPGGTAEVVAVARQGHKAIAWIHNGQIDLENWAKLG